MSSCDSETCLLNAPGVEVYNEAVQEEGMNGRNDVRCLGARGVWYKCELGESSREKGT